MVFTDERVESTKPNQAHATHQLTPTVLNVALEPKRQNKKCKADSMDTASNVNQVPLMLAHTEKLTTHASPVNKFISFAHSITTIENIDVDNLVVNTKQVKATAQKIPMGRGTLCGLHAMKSDEFDTVS